MKDNQKMTTELRIAKMEEQLHKFTTAKNDIIEMGQTFEDRLSKEEFLKFAEAVTVVLQVRRELQQQLEDWKSSEDNRQHGAVGPQGEQDVQPQPEVLLSRSQRRRRRWLRIREILIARDAEAGSAC